MAGSVYTFVGNANPGSAITSITTSQGVVALNHSGLFLPSEYTGATAAGCILEVGPATTPVGQLSAPTVVAGSTGVLNGTYKYVWTFVTAVGETIASPEATITVSSKYVSVSNAPIGTPTSGVLARKLYRTTAGGGSGSERLVTTLNDNTTTSYTDNTADGSLGAPVPVVDTSAVPGGIPGGGGGGGGGSFLTQAEADARYALIGSGGTSRNLIIGGSLGSTFTLNMSATTDQWLEGTLSANLALTVSGIVAGVSGTMLLTQDATGGRTLTINGTNVPIPNSASAYFTVLLHSADGTDLDVTVPGGAPVPVNAATVGTDGNLGGPGGSPLSAAVGIRTSNATAPSAAHSALEYQTLYPQDFGTFGTGSDDTPAVQAALDAAIALGGTVNIQLTPTVRLQSALRVDRQGFSVLALPSPSQASFILKFTAAEGGTTFIAPQVGLAYSASFGYPSLIGGGTIEQTGPGAGVQFWNGLLLWEGDFFWSLPANPTLMALDMSGIGRCRLLYAEARAAGSGATTPVAFTPAFRFPEGDNSAEVEIGYVFASGFYVATVGNTWLNAKKINAFQCICAHAWTGNTQYASNDGHSSHLGELASQNCAHHIASWSPTAGVISLPAGKPMQFVIDKWDIQDAASGAYATVDHLLDANNQMTGRALYGRVLGGTGRQSGLTVNGGQNLALIDITTTATRTLGQANSTGPNGVALVNGTPNILTWTAPNDGNLHFATVGAVLATTSTCTGGAVNISGTTGGVAWAHTLIGANQTAGGATGTSGPVAIDPGTTLTVLQATALTAGAAKLYAGIFAQ